MAEQYVKQENGMLKQFIRVVCAAMCLFAAHTCFAAEFPRDLLIVRPEGSWPPWEMITDGELEGIHINLVREAAGKLNIPVTIKTYPWKRAIQMLKQGKADAITYMSRTDEREQFGYFFDGNILSQAPIGLFMLKEYESSIHFSGNLKSLQSYTIGTCLGYAYQDEFDKADWLTKDDGAPDEKILLQKLIAKRFQIAAGYVNDVKYNARQVGIFDQIVFLRPYLSEGRAVYLVFSKAKHHEELARQFADAMKVFKTTPQYDDLLKKYGVD